MTAGAVERTGGILCQLRRRPRTGRRHASNRNHSTFHGMAASGENGSEMNVANADAAKGEEYFSLSKSAVMSDKRPQTYRSLTTKKQK